jgi:hypothetical protein
MSTRRRFVEAPGYQADCQMIGLVTSRVSGILLSRDAYLDVLREIMTVDSVSIEEARQRECKINLFAGAMSLKTLDQMGPRPGKNIWCLVLESTHLPLRAKETAAKIDQVWVPTQFCLDVCLKAGLSADKVKLVPYYMRSPKRPRIPPASDAPFTFLTSWDGKSSMNRKFILGAIEAFKKAFPRAKSVCLKLKTRELSEENTELVRLAIGNDERIVFEDRFTESPDDLYDHVHAIFHPHRAEGYGRHMIEAQMRRLPVICTGYSGNMDWMHSGKNALLISYLMVETAQKEFQYPQGGFWALPNIDHAAQQLRYCRDHYDTLGPMLDAAEIDSRATSSLERSKQAMIKALASL